MLSRKQLLLIEALDKKKDLLLLANKLIEKVPRQECLRKKNRKSVKQWKIITYWSKTFENPNIIDKKSIIKEHLETSHKLLKTIRQVEKLFILWYKRHENILNQKNMKKNKTRTCF